MICMSTCFEPRGGEKLHIKPKSGELLFYPEHIDATISGGTVKGRSHLALMSAFAFLKKNGSNGRKIQMQIQGSVPILCVNAIVLADCVKF